MAGERYKILEEIGQGPLGAVHRALHLGLAAEVAVKIYHSKIAGIPEFAAALSRQAARAARLKHPNILKVFDGPPAGEAAFLAQDLSRGKTLRTVLDRFHALPPAWAINMAKETALGLEYLHDHEFVHAGLHPGGIFVEASGSCRLGDLGQGRALADARIAHPQAADRRTYRPPERAPEEIPSPADDLYALGAILLEMLSGRPAPVPLDPEQIRPLLAGGRADLPPGVDEFLARSLDPRPDRRFSDALSFYWALEEIRKEEPAEAAPADKAAAGDRTAGGRPPSLPSSGLKMTETADIRRKYFTDTDELTREAQAAKKKMSSRPGAGPPPPEPRPKPPPA